ncbi:hypothetical protein OS493_014954 [Desmophyllum pertusum]|uniref:Uncharacterized protein n=1 Tax=Desmophyllum pertusum TaxID=174260 RepID=A0A9X0A2W7_9CNID|nr:hypothetical protein OS493_014954 [Desmophyllum pertusum]
MESAEKPKGSDYRLVLLGFVINTFMADKHKIKTTADAYETSHDVNAEVNGGCATARLGSTSYSGSTTIPERNWIETPSVIVVHDQPDVNAEVNGGCTTARLGSTSYSGSTTIPERNWIETPSVIVVHDQPG